MKINRNGQLWRFIDRYCSYHFTYLFEHGSKGDICSLVRGFFVATLKCAGITTLGFVALQALLTPWYLFIVAGVPCLRGDQSLVNAIAIGGTIIQFLIIGSFVLIGLGKLLRVMYNFVWLKKRPSDPPEWVNVANEYIAGIKGKYCTRVELT
jgi:hypothetical protein